MVTDKNVWIKGYCINHSTQQNHQRNTQENVLLSSAFVQLHSSNYMVIKGLLHPSPLENNSHLRWVLINNWSPRTGLNASNLNSRVYDWTCGFSCTAPLDLVWTGDRGSTKPQAATHLETPAVRRRSSISLKTAICFADDRICSEKVGLREEPEDSG